MDDSLQDQCEQLMELYCNLKERIRRSDRRLFERWKAGGYLIDSDIFSTYPNLEEVVEQLEEEEEEEDREESEEDEE